MDEVVSPEVEALAVQFMAITGCITDSDARLYLRESGSNLEMAVAMFFDVAEDVAEVVAEDEGQPEQQEPEAGLSRREQRKKRKKRKKQRRQQRRKDQRNQATPQPPPPAADQATTKRAAAQQPPPPPPQEQQHRAAEAAAPAEAPAWHDAVVNGVGEPSDDDDDDEAEHHKTLALIPCCLCGAEIEPNDNNNMCPSCLSTDVNAASRAESKTGRQSRRQVALQQCGDCGRYMNAKGIWVASARCVVRCSRPASGWADAAAWGATYAARLRLIEERRTETGTDAHLADG